MLVTATYTTQKAEFLHRNGGIKTKSTPMVHSRKMKICPLPYPPPRVLELAERQIRGTR